MQMNCSSVYLERKEMHACEHGKTVSGVWHEGWKGTLCCLTGMSRNSILCGS